MENKIPSSLMSIITQLEDNNPPQNLSEVLDKLNELAHDTPEIKLAYTHLLSQSPVITKEDPKNIAKIIRDYFNQKSSMTATENKLNLQLDFDTIENIKKELRTTYNENNIVVLANGKIV